MPTIAFQLVILAATLHAVWNFATKKIAGDLAVIWNGLVMACITFTPFIFFLAPDQMAFQKVYPHIIASGVTHAVYFFALAKAYEYGEISVVYPIARGSGIAGTAIAAFLLLQETISPIGVIGILAISVGIFLLGLKNGHQKHGILFALLVGLMIISYSIVDKLAVEISHPLFYIYGFTVLSTLLLAPYVMAKKRHELSEAWRSKKRYSFTIGLGSMGTYLIILFVFQMAQVSYVVAARELAVAIGAILGFIFLKEHLTARKAIGIIAVVAGMILIKMA